MVPDGLLDRNGKHGNPEDADIAPACRDARKNDQENDRVT
jgi:hypothetical protein